MPPATSLSSPSCCLSVSPWRGVMGGWRASNPPPFSALLWASWPPSRVWRSWRVVFGAGGGTFSRHHCHTCLGRGNPRRRSLLRHQEGSASATKVRRPSSVSRSSLALYVKNVLLSPTVLWCTPAFSAILRWLNPLANLYSCFRSTVASSIFLCVSERLTMER